MMKLDEDVESEADDTVVKQDPIIAMKDRVLLVFIHIYNGKQHFQIQKILPIHRSNVRFILATPRKRWP